MRKRSDAIRRILDVEYQLRRAAEAKLSDLQKAEAELAAQRCELLAWLNGDLPPLQGLVGAATGRLVRLGTALEQAAQELAAQQRIVLERHGREKRAERLAGSLRRTESQAREKLLLQEILEAHVRASLP